MKVFRLFRLERIVCFGVQSVDTVSTCATKQLEYQNYHFLKLKLAFILQQTFGSNYVVNHTQLMDRLIEKLINILLIYICLQNIIPQVLH